jgi:hypothetical protein
MITFGLSVPVPTIDNSAAIAATMRRVAFEERCATRALDFLSLPFVREDEVLRDIVNDHLLDCGERAWVASQDGYALFVEDGSPAPTQETWDALQPWEREAIVDDYVERDCRTGLWETNPWGDLVERNSSVFARR